MLTTDVKKKEHVKRKMKHDISQDTNAPINHMRIYIEGNQVQKSRHVNL